jgi:hypothetical protein
LAIQVRDFINGPAMQAVATLKDWVKEHTQLVSSIIKIGAAFATFTGVVWAGNKALQAVLLSLRAIKTLGGWNLLPAPAKAAAAVTGAAVAVGEANPLGLTAEQIKRARSKNPSEDKPEGEPDTHVPGFWENIHKDFGWNSIKEMTGFARGGIINVGEAGLEAVIPLVGPYSPATEKTAQLMLNALQAIKDIWQNFTGVNRGGAIVGGIGGATPGGGGGGGTGQGGGGQGTGQGRGGGDGSGGGSIPSNAPAALKAAEDQLRKEGVPEANIHAAAAALIGNAGQEGLNPTAHHDVNKQTGAFGLGIYGASAVRKGPMLAWMRAQGYADNSLEGQARYMAHEAMSAQYGATRQALMGANEGNLNSVTETVMRNFERPSKDPNVARLDNRQRYARQAFAGQYGGGETQGRATPAGATLPVGQTVPGLKELEAASKDIIGGRKRISAENDAFHHGLAYHSKHIEGLAFDQSLIDRSKHAEAAEYMRNILHKAGLTDKDFMVKDEYAHPSGAATGGHIHSQFNTRERAERFKKALGGEGRATPAIPDAHKKILEGMNYGPQLPATKTPEPAGQGGGGGGGVGAACNCGGAMQAAAGGLGERGILGALFGASGVASMLSPMLRLKRWSGCWWPPWGLVWRYGRTREWNW